MGVDKSWRFDVDFTTLGLGSGKLWLDDVPAQRLLPPPLLKLSLTSPFLLIRPSSSSKCLRGKLKPSNGNSIPKVPILTLQLTSNSGDARSLRTTAFRQPQVLPRTFQPLKKSLAPATSARFASSDVRDGKIHQVIGAVVDGKSSPQNPQPR